MKVVLLAFGSMVAVVLCRCIGAALVRVWDRRRFAKLRRAVEALDEKTRLERSRCDAAQAIRLEVTGDGSEQKEAA